MLMGDDTEATMLMVTVFMSLAIESVSSITGLCLCLMMVLSSSLHVTML